MQNQWMNWLRHAFHDQNYKQLISWTNIYDLNHWHIVAYRQNFQQKTVQITDMIIFH